VSPKQARVEIIGINDRNLQFDVSDINTSCLYQQPLDRVTRPNTCYEFF